MSKTVIESREVSFSSGEETFGLKVFRKRVLVEGGKEEVYWQYSLPNNVTVFPVTKDGKIIGVVESHPEVPTYLHLIGETMEKDEDPLAAAQRGLLEETGYQAEQYRLLSTILDIDDGPARCVPPQEPNPHRSEESKETERKRMLAAYRILHQAVGINLQMGWSLIVSATYSRKGSQDFLVKAVKENGGLLKVIWCKFDDTPEEVGRRIEDRLTRAAVGGCRSVEHYLSDKSRYEGTDMNHLSISTSESLDDVVRKAMDYINWEEGF
jgi:hypothetical protein